MRTKKLNPSLQVQGELQEPIRPSPTSSRYGRAAILRRRQGAALERSAPRSLLQRLLGRSRSTVALKAKGDRPLYFDELEKIALSEDPAVNPWHVVTDAAAVVLAARNRVSATALTDGLIARSTLEQFSDGEEDRAQMELRGALEVLRLRGPTALTFDETIRVRRSLLAYRDIATRHIAEELAVVADVEALIPQISTRH